MKSITYTRTAVKQLAKMPLKDSTALVGKLQRFAETGEGDVKKLKGTEDYRLRHGIWRARFTDDGRLISVTQVRNRGSAY